MDAVLAALALGFVLGLQHATDPDHLVAVATIVSRERRFADGARIGVFWGLGHTATLTLVGGAIVALGLRPGAALAAGLELVVAAMLVLLGAARLRDAARGLARVPADHLRADHDHGGVETVHSHAHVHDGRVHAHPHVHPSRHLLAALAGRGASRRALLVGAVHGVAGSAAIPLLVLATLHSRAGALAYLGVFGLGTIAGMTALTAAMAFPVSAMLRARRFGRALAAGAGGGSIVLGAVWALGAVSG